jgi:hypothetical protein
LVGAPQTNEPAFTPTNIVPYREHQGYGWIILLKTNKSRIKWKVEGRVHPAPSPKTWQVTQENRLSKFGTVSLDGSKIHANASRHSALSHGHIEKIEALLKSEVQEMLALAEEADQSSLSDGMNLPDEIKRLEDRLAAIAQAKATIEARAKERFEREKAEYDAKDGGPGRQGGRIGGTEGARPGATRRGSSQSDG